MTHLICLFENFIRSKNRQFAFKYNIKLIIILIIIYSLKMYKKLLSLAIFLALAYCGSQTATITCTDSSENI